MSLKRTACLFLFFGFVVVAILAEDILDTQIEFLGRVPSSDAFEEVAVAMQRDLQNSRANTVVILDSLSNSVTNAIQNELSKVASATASIGGIGVGYVFRFHFAPNYSSLYVIIVYITGVNRVGTYNYNFHAWHVR